MTRDEIEKKAWELYVDWDGNNVTLMPLLIEMAEWARKGAIDESIACIEKTRLWVRDCQIEKENAGENEKPDFIRQSILSDVQKDLRRLRDDRQTD